MIMSNEVTEHERLGSPKEIVFVLKEVISSRKKTIRNVKEYCISNIQHRNIPIAGIISFIHYLGFVDIADEKIKLSRRGKAFLLSLGKNELKNALMKQLMDVVKSDKDMTDFLDSKHIKYDYGIKKYTIKNSAFSLKYSGIKNFMIKCGFLKRDNSLPNIYLLDYDFIKKFKEQIKEIHKRKTLLQFKKEQKRLEQLGKEAEQFVLSYEKNRLSKQSLKNKVLRISEFDTNAGFDIVSFDSNQSKEYDRFIEVKSCDSRRRLFWTRNEVRVAKVKKRNYYIYLVNRDKMNKPEYQPEIIQNPIKKLFDNSLWRKECNVWEIIPVNRLQ